MNGLYYNRSFLTKQTRAEILEWLATLHPIWEMRFSEHNPPPPGEKQRELLRPVYWLGNWQFACLNYYHPPKGTTNRCVQAEPFPKVLQKLVDEIESKTRRMFQPSDIPKGWHLNTCLINYYGSKIIDGKRHDRARVGEHKDFEPGPVASISIGERAMFQFVSSRRKGTRDAVAFQQWLDDSSLQIFGGRRFKSELFHRVQRVDKKLGFQFPLNNMPDYETRRINFTFRYVPLEHFVRFKKLPAPMQDDVRGYMQELAKYSLFFEKEL